jgi:S-adenosyl-L-methionine hydrolase (adenosine-forming)
MARQIVTLTTDFGHSDHFVGVIKGVILKQNPDVEIVDICNEVRPYDILDGAYTIGQAYRHFPLRTIHLVVVDPGVGTARRPIMVRTDLCWFIAPDNGVLSFVYAMEESKLVRHITANHYFLNPVSQTFQARDIFASVAGWLSRDVEFSKFGDEVTDYVKFAPPKAKVIDARTIQGVVIKVDRFGNLITNITPEDVPQLFAENPPPFKMVCNNKEVTKLNLAYAQSAPGEVFIILGSSGYLELATNRGAASRILGADRGAQIQVAFG